MYVILICDFYTLKPMDHVYIHITSTTRDERSDFKRVINHRKHFHFDNILVPTFPTMTYDGRKYMYSDYNNFEQSSSCDISLANLNKKTQHQILFSIFFNQIDLRYGLVWFLCFSILTNLQRLFNTEVISCGKEQY